MAGPAARLTPPMSEDKIIDLTIALESTLLFKTNGELQYRLALRGAKLLRESREPSETQSLLAAVYDVRSAIVHDGKSLDESMRRAPARKVVPSLEGAGDLVQRTEEVVRDVIKGYLAEMSGGKLISKVNQELEEGIVRALGNTEADS